MAKSNEKENKYFDLGSEWSVINARKLDFGVFFTLQVPGLSLYDLRVVPAGKNYDAFIAPPETKGKDGIYFKRYGLYLSEDDTAEILAAVDEALTDSEKPKKKTGRK